MTWHHISAGAHETLKGTLGPSRQDFQESTYRNIDRKVLEAFREIDGLDLWDEVRHFLNMNAGLPLRARAMVDGSRLVFISQI
jgi:hypothetical protein